MDDEGREFEGGAIVTRYIDRMAFPGEIDQPFWANSDAPRLVVDFTTPEVGPAAGARQAVRCVRP